MFHHFNNHLINRKKAVDSGFFIQQIPPPIPIYYFNEERGIKQERIRLQLKDRVRLRKSLRHFLVFHGIGKAAVG